MKPTKRTHANYTPEQRQRAVELAGQIGVSPAAHRLGMPASSIQNWLSRGLPTKRINSTATKAAKVLPSTKPTPVVHAGTADFLDQAKARLHKLDEQRAALQLVIETYGG